MLGSGYILSYLIISSNRKSENYNSEVKQIIRDNEHNLRNIIDQLEQSKNDLKDQENDNINLVNTLNEYLQRA